MKTPKFLICDNPMVTGSNEGRLFILHTQPPIILAEVFHLDIDDEPAQLECKANFEIGSSTEHGDESIILGALWVITC